MFLFLLVSNIETLRAMKNTTMFLLIFKRDRDRRVLEFHQKNSQTSPL
jgi:hypothetical protein